MSDEQIKQALRAFSMMAPSAEQKRSALAAIARMTRTA